MAVQEIQPGQIWVNNGIPYIISGYIFDATNYEKTKKLPKMVCYTQAKDAKLPAGTPYVRDEQDFRANFTFKPD